MLKENYYKYWIIGLTCLGAILRVTIFLVSPANNSYDDHLEVIEIYADNFSRPAPFQCWECYQPPLYYYIGASIFSLAELLGLAPEMCWKIVQAVNPLLSITVLIIVYQILRLFKMSKLTIAIVLSFVVVLPRDIFTSAMIGNDYMLVFFAVLAFYLFLRTIIAIKNKRNIWKWVVLLMLTATLGSLTKQHGLLLHLFPGVVFLVLCKKTTRKKLYWAIPILFLGGLISLSEEAWKYNKTGEFLVSNQHYFDYAKDQFPGSLDRVEFLSFRISRLYQDPFISESTSASFLTELFARTFYDYEWRFISPKIPWAKTLGHIAYSVGLTWLTFFIVIIVFWIKQLKKTVLKISWDSIVLKGTPLLLAFLFMLVPFLQTLRYPYFSSMKSMFMLSGIMLLILILGNFMKKNSWVERLGMLMILLNMAYGVLLVISIAIYIGTSANYLHGPLWSFP